MNRRKTVEEVLPLPVEVGRCVKKFLGSGGLLLSCPFCKKDICCRTNHDASAHFYLCKIKHRAGYVPPKPARAKKKKFLMEGGDLGEIGKRERSGEGVS